MGHASPLCPAECLAENKPTKERNFPGVEVTFSLELMEIKFPFLLGTLIDPTGMEGRDSWVRVSDQGILRPHLLPMRHPHCILWPPLCRPWPSSRQPAPPGHSCKCCAERWCGGSPIPAHFWSQCSHRPPREGHPQEDWSCPSAWPCRAALWVLLGPSEDPTPASAPRLLPAVRSFQSPALGRPIPVATPPGPVIQGQHW